MIPLAAGPDLKSYDVILISISGGKDSQTILRQVVFACDAQEIPRSRIVAVLADLGRAEWPGTKELARRQAEHYGLRFEVVQRTRGDILDETRVRRRWASPQQRWCTAHHKRDQINKLVVRLTDERKAFTRVLNCQGMRAAESPARSKLVPFQVDVRNTNRKRHVDRWLPIHGWSTPEVWADIKESGVPWHPAYDLGMPRLSCVFCIFSPRAALLLAGKHNRELLEEYVALEREIGHTFKKGFKLESILEALVAGEDPGKIQDWVM